MDIDKMNEKERYDMLAEMADQYYNQGKTQSEIAAYFDTNRFRVAKLLQDARNENVVEIKINTSNERNKSMEKELMEKCALDHAIVINTQYSSYINNLTQIGKVGADYLNQLLMPASTVGVAWGKTIYSVVSQLSTNFSHSVTAVQLTGDSSMNNPLTDTRELVRAIATAYNGTYRYLSAPLYASSEEMKNEMLKEPRIQESMKAGEQMDVILTGIGSLSSLPFVNPAFQPYLTEKDKANEKHCLGSLFGYILDENGAVADIDLNRKLIGQSMETIRKVPHRLVVACGKHKAEILAKAVKNGLFNELLTDNDTAVHLLEML